MKKIIFILIVLLGIGNDSFAQMNRVDSLRQQLGTVDKKAGAEIMIELANIYWNINPDSANYYWHTVLSIAKNDTLRARAMAGLSALYQYSRPDSTLFYANLALKLLKPYRLIGIEEGIMSSVILAYYAMGNISKAIQLSLQALQLAEKNNLPFSEGLDHDMLGTLQSTAGSNNMGIVNQKEALKYFHATGANGLLIATLAGISESYAGLNLTDSAIYYAQLTEKALGSDSTYYFVLDILGSTYYKIGDLKKSLECYHRSMHSTELYLSFKGNLEIAKIYQLQNEHDSSLFYGMKALKIAQESGFYSNIIAANTFLSGYYEKRNPEKALEYAQHAIIYKDSLTELERSMTIADFYNADEEQRQNEIDTAKKDFQYRLKMNALMGSSFTLLVVAFVLYRSRRQKQKAKKHIEEAYDQLKATQSQLIQSEKMASLGELTAGIAHEIQNPLNFVNNFSEVNNELIDELSQELAVGNMQSAEEIAKSIKENQAKINQHGKRADSIVKNMLQHSRGSSDKKELTDINALADEFLKLAYHGMRARDQSFNAELKTDFDPSLPKVNVVPQDIGRVLVNLINNAFQALSTEASSGSEVKTKATAKADGSYQPTVTISTNKPDGKIEIRISDNGPGIPENIKDKIFQPFFTTKPTGQGTGLGLSLSYDIVKAHGGEIKVESKEGEGTEFIIQLPV